MYREVSRVLGSKPTLEGAGVRLKRVFGYYEAKIMDPFLLLDDFHSENPDDYMAGFPWHPHRGIETVTYMMHGSVEHGDSIGNKGVIEDGDVQWMTAGNGIIHQEMPQKTEGMMQGFQLWINLPSKNKMMPPRYRDVKNKMIPRVKIGDNVEAKIISGKIRETAGPVQDIVVDIEYFDIKIPPETTLEYPTESGHTAFAYVFMGKAYFGKEERLVGKEHLILYDHGDKIRIVTGGDDVRFLLVSGKPIGEPIAWRGPIVMNTDAELDQAFREYHEGTFIKHEI